MNVIVAHHGGGRRQGSFHFARPPSRGGLGNIAALRRALSTGFMAAILSCSTGASQGDAGADAGPACASPEAPRADPAIHTPRWAFEPWISKDISDTDDTYAFVGGFEQRGIPVGAVVLDSPWETNYNTFVPNPKRYHDFDALLSDMHARGVRVVLWITQLVNTTSYDLEPGGDTYPPNPAFDEALACGYFVNGGATDFWWKGTGGSIDFFDGRARAWFHRLEDGVLDRGVDGFKVDFGDSYIRQTPIRTVAGEKSLQEYSEAYYADFYRYGRSKRGPDFVTMVRPWDESYQFAGRFYARKEHAPVAWVGDNRRDFFGFEDALQSIFRSARAGYVTLGSDVGGYLDRDDKNLSVEIPYDHEAFSRWVSAMALMPFMQLHGRANLTPWTVPVDPDGFVALYKYWATLHHELAGWLYDLAERAYAGGPVPVDPQGAEGAWAGDERWVLGGTFLVAPILGKTGTRDVALPAGARWIDWWTGAAVDGGTTLGSYDATPLSKMPLFVKEGSIFTAEVASDLTGLGTAASQGALTVVVAPSAAQTSFVHLDADEQPTTFGVAGRTIALSRALRTTILRVRTETSPAAVTVDGAAWTKRADRASFDAAPDGWLDDSARELVWIKLAPSASGRVVVF